MEQSVLSRTNVDRAAAAGAAGAAGAAQFFDANFFRGELSVG